MPLNAEQLRKILELERKKGYTDAAVIGGLDRFLRQWAVQAKTSITSPGLLRRFQQLRPAEARYAALSPEERAKYATTLLDFLTEVETGDKQARATSVKPAPPLPSRKATPAPSPPTAGSLDAAVTTLKGVSAPVAGKLAKLGVNTVRDLLYLFPHRHLDYSRRRTISQLAEGEEQTVIANVWQAQVSLLGGRRSTEAIIGDETGNIRAVWFNNPYLAKQLKTNTTVVISGRVRLFGGRPVFESPEWERLEDQELTHTGRLVPVYPLTSGLRSRQVRKLVKEVVDRWAPAVTDYLPPESKKRCRLLDLPEALAQAHYPENETMKDRARTRLAFDELFLLQLGVLGKKRDWQESQPGHPLTTDAPLLSSFIAGLPFTLTPAQQRVLAEMMADLARSRPMSRLLQGEVGSGKTVIATTALLAAVASGYQGALMAPTEILAEQHFATIGQLLARLGAEETDGYLRRYSGLLSRPLTIALIMGDLTQRRKQAIQQQLRAGEIDVAIGTHALIQKDVGFSRLGLAVVDEQHRFGVVQRSALRQKGYNPHMLVMTATPIPRTLALTLYGDLDLSVIDELPPGRQPVKTKWLEPRQRASAYSFIQKQIAAGRQAFIICPLVEESEAVQARAAVAEFEYLSQQVFPSLKLGLLHGRLKTAEKDKVMRRFHAGELHILVSTPVVEVGIDVPNATVMLIESADRFGLSQLHQFRGRVGRGPEQSYCLLLAENPSDIGQQRLDLIEKTQDGFELAEADMHLRGPGEFFGTRQSGLPDLKMARLTDVALLELARKEAARLFELDPKLKKPEHRPLAQELARVWPDNLTEFS